MGWWLVVAFLPVVVPAGHADARDALPIATGAGARPYSDGADPERARLRHRTGEELASEPLPRTREALSFELSVLYSERDAIDISAITAVQWTGAVVMILGGVGTLGTLFVGSVVYAFGGGPDYVYYGLAIGLPVIALGAIVLALAEVDAGLHRRRELSGRIRRLLDFERFAILPSASADGAGVAVSVAF